MDLKDGGPAFPLKTTRATTDGSEPVEHPGLTIRDYFAAKAMSAIMDRMPEHSPSYVVQNVESVRHRIAAAAYEVADAMLAARNR